MKAGTQTGTYTPMFFAVLFTIARSWKRLSASADKWIKEMTWYSHTMEYYGAKKGMRHWRRPHINGPWKHDAKRKKSDAKGQNCVIPLVWGAKNSKFRDREESSAYWGLGVGVRGDRASVWGDENILEITMVIVRRWEYPQCHWIVHLKKIKMEDFPGSPVVKILYFHCTGYIPSQRTKIPHAPWPKKKN